MAPRIAFVLALAFAATASADVASQESASNLQLYHAPRVLQGSESSAVQVGLDGALPVIELTAPAQLPETIDLTSEPEELFQRLRQGFAMPNINTSLVLHHQQYYQNRPEYLRRMVERSSRYLHYIVEEIDKRGMPMELALLPMVESAYNPTAYSRSRASGLWQFVPSTGKQYRLEQNSWVDERRDVVASTVAALDYLQYIYELHGDWHLALASYNWGEGAVGRAIAKNKAQGLPTDYLSLSMPEETRNYVPKLQALKNIFSNPRVLAELNIRGVPNRPYFATVTRTGNIDVKLAAQLAGMPMQEFVALNPSHNRAVIKSDTPMVIPTDKVDTFLSNLDAHEESQKPLSSWQSYTLQAGERLEDVAPRFGMTVANLKSLNGINGRLKVAPGETLLVGGQDGAPLPEPAAGGGEEKPLVAEVPRPAAVASPRPPAPRTHTVAKGETLLKVAKRYGMTLADIKHLNKLSTGKVTPGMKLAIAAVETGEKPAPMVPRTVVADLDSKAAAQPEPAASGKRTHTVQKGETLTRIAQRYGMTVAELKQINKLRADKAVAGSKLALLPTEPDGKPARVSRELLAEAASKPSLEQRQDSPTTATRTHTVQKGETLAKIAQRYGLSLAELKQINKLRNDRVAPGTRLAMAASDSGGRMSAERSPVGSEGRTRQVGADRERAAKNPSGRRAEESPREASRPGGKKPAKLAQYTIRRGDTLVSIAKQFRVEKDDLLRWNRLPGNAIKPGQTLTIQMVQNTF